MFSTSIPEWEIHLSGEPVAQILYPSGFVKFYKMDKTSKFFVLRDGKYSGVYSVNSKYRWMIGKTPCYFYSYDESNPIDPIMIDELNKYKKRNRLTEIKQKDIEHASRLRELANKLKHQSNGDAEKTPMNLLEEEQKRESGQLEEVIQTAITSMETHTSELKTKYKKDVNLQSEEKSYILLQHLKVAQKITPEQYATFIYKISNNMMNFESLIEDLRSMKVVRIAEPLDENVEDFIQDLGSQNPREWAGFTQDLRNNKKGLKDMTAKPVKSFIPAGVILAIGLVVIFAIIVIPQNMDSITKGLGGDGGFKLPFLGGKMIDWLALKIPWFSDFLY